MTVTTGTTQPFTATVSNTSEMGVGWLVNGFPGGIDPISGSSPFGTIDKNGNYTAPPFIPTPPNVTVTAVANADNSATANAAVSINGTASPVSISPTSASLSVGGIALFTGTAGPGQAVNWLVENILNGDTNVGTINPVPGSTDQVTYTAPLVVPGGAQSAQVHVTVQSVANPLEAASALVTISAATGSAVVTIITPRTPPTVPLGEAQSFQASVTGVSDTAVSWEVDAIPGGNASVGTITAGANDTALYTAPKQLPGNPMVTVTAVSNADPAATASLDVTLIKGQAASVAVHVEGCINTNAVVVNSTVQLTALVSNVPSQDVTWQVNKVTGGNSTIGTITPGGLYTAPAKLPSPATVVISAVSVDDPSAVGNQPLTISVSPVAVVQVSPSKASIEVDQSPPDFSATVLGLGDARVNWYVNGILGGDEGSVGQITGGEPSGCVTTAQYLAPPTVPAPPLPNPVPVWAVASDGTTSSQILVTITPGPQYTLTLDPSGEVFVMVGQQQPYCAMDSDPSDTVTWSVSGSSCAGAACGTIVPGVPNSQCSNLPAVYTAPPNVPTPVPTVTVTVSSVKHEGLNATDEVYIQGAAVPSISITPSSQTVAAGRNEIAFSAIIQNYAQNALVVWELGCISDWDGGLLQNCNDTDRDGDGPGCIEVQGGRQACGETPASGAGNLPLTYTSPQNLFTTDFQVNQCSGQNNDGNGYVQLTVTLQASGCFQNVCTATACIKVTP
jgi:hypothetical protein